MPLKTTSRNANFLEDQSETVTISRRTKTSNNSFGEPIWSVAVIYTGPADVQETRGDVLLVKAGETLSVDAEMTIEPAYGADPLVLQVGDKVVTDGGDFLVINAVIWNFPYKHTYADLKEGAGW